MGNTGVLRKVGSLPTNPSGPEDVDNTYNIRPTNRTLGKLFPALGARHEMSTVQKHTINSSIHTDLTNVAIRFIFHTFLRLLRLIQQSHFADQFRFLTTAAVVDEVGGEYLF